MLLNKMFENHSLTHGTAARSPERDLFFFQFNAKILDTHVDNWLTRQWLERILKFGIQKFFECQNLGDKHTT
ncbi:hypothetical protein FOCC_FOCC003815 [Frankliniella occidentalis]|nr:hypothetical protein FOCC_FOCC003815 [Frankliniella occidentalis]